MKHTYHIDGITCTGCKAKVEKLITSLPGVVSAYANLETGDVEVNMINHVSFEKLQEAFSEHPKYQLSSKMVLMPKVEESEDTRSWVEIYKPILLIFFFIATVSLAIQFKNQSFNQIQWMGHFMAGFFLVFSFFKFLNLSEFADSYKMYDLPAKYIPGYAIAYPFIEFGLGMLYLLGIEPFLTNVLTAIVMAISLVGVAQSVLDKRKIKCACLGAVFNLPMSTVTIVEDFIMLGMASAMLLIHK